MTHAVLESPTQPEYKAIRVTCDRCNGTRKQAKEWDILTGAVVAYGPCGSCLGQGHVMVTPTAA